SSSRTKCRSRPPKSATAGISTWSCAICTRPTTCASSTTTVSARSACSGCRSSARQSSTSRRRRRGDRELIGGSGRDFVRFPQAAGEHPAQLERDLGVLATHLPEDGGGQEGDACVVQRRDPRPAHRLAGQGDLPEVRRRRQGPDALVIDDRKRARLENQQIVPEGTGGDHLFTGPVRTDGSRAGYLGKGFERYIAKERHPLQPEDPLKLTVVQLHLVLSGVLICR